MTTIKMYKMPTNSDGMIPQDDYSGPHTSFLDKMGRENLERPPHRETHQPPSLSSLKAVKLVKKRKRSVPYVCHIVSCGEKFLNSKGLDTHMKLHLGVKPFTCNLCGKVCQTESKLKHHQASHANDGVKPVCDICERTFSSRSSLNKHKKIIHKPKPHICPGCHYGFEERRYMVIHAKQAHDLDLSLEVPDTDDEEFAALLESEDESSKETLKNSYPVSDGMISSPVITLVNEEHGNLQEKHLNSLESSSSSRKPVSINCKLCTSTFPSVAYLEQHMAVHVNESIFTCRVCAQNFNNREDLSNHMKLHSTGNEYFHSYQQTTTKYTLISDKYVCFVCKENFQNLGSLKRHEAKGHCNTSIGNGL